MPKNWLNTNPLSDIREKVNLLEKNSIEEFTNYRAQYIEETIAIESDELDDNLHYYVDVAVANSKPVNTCKKCFKIYKRDVIICPSCGNNDILHDLNYDPYYRTISKHPDVAPKVTIREQCMVNNNSIVAA